MSKYHKRWLRKFTEMWDSNHHPDNKAEYLLAADVEQLLIIIGAQKYKINALQASVERERHECETRYF